MRGSLRSVGSRHRPRRELDAHERLFLSPFVKWWEYGRFPWAFTLHALLIVLTVSEVMCYLSRDVDHFRRTISHFSKTFLSPDGGKVSFTKPDAVREWLRGAVDAAFRVDDYSVATYELQDPENLVIALKWRNGTSHRVSLHQSLYFSQYGGSSYVNESFPAVFGRDSLKLIALIMEIRINVHIKEPELHTALDILDEASHCYSWYLSIILDGCARGEFIGKLEHHISSCNIQGASGKGFFASLHIAVMTVAGIALVLIAAKIRRACKIYNSIRGAAGNGRDECSLSRVELLTLFNKWWILSAVAHVVQITSSAYSLANYTFANFRFMMLGWSSFLSWLTICQYFEHFPGYYSTFSTLSSGISSVCRFMLSVLPILSAFAFLGMCIFWKTDYFKGPISAYASLFSLLNGDMVHDSFDAASDSAGIFGHVYLYAFIFIFIYVVLNVNITIIEEAFYNSRKRGSPPQCPSVVHEQAELLSCQTADSQWTRASRHKSGARIISAAGPSDSAEHERDLQQISVGADLTPETNSHRTDRLGSFSQPTSSYDMKTRPFLSNLGEGRGSTQLPDMRWMSPRYSGNPRLQDAFAATFPCCKDSSVECAPHRLAGASPSARTNDTVGEGVSPLRTTAKPRFVLEVDGIDDDSWESALTTCIEALRKQPDVSRELCCVGKDLGNIAEVEELRQRRRRAKQLLEDLRRAAEEAASLIFAEDQTVLNSNSATSS